MSQSYMSAAHNLNPGLLFIALSLYLERYNGVSEIFPLELLLFSVQWPSHAETGGTSIVCVLYSQSLQRFMD
jgi:hypothetical protein